MISYFSSFCGDDVPPSCSSGGASVSAGDSSSLVVVLGAAAAAANSCLNFTVAGDSTTIGGDVVVVCPTNVHSFFNGPLISCSFPLSRRWPFQVR